MIVKLFSSLSSSRGIFAVEFSVILYLTEATDVVKNQLIEQKRERDGGKNFAVNISGSMWSYWL